ncbi:MAG: flavin reductase family protein [Beijerinckiaceae bacterium]
MLFYEPHLRDKSVLPHDPFKALIAPRPIGWVSTISRSGAINLAPYSYFNAVADKPPMLAFSSVGKKDSQTFIEETGEFVWNMPTWDLRESMNVTSASFPQGDNEFPHAHLEMASCRLVKPPRVATSPCALECKVTYVIPLKDVGGVPSINTLIVGQVVGVHLDERYIDASGIVEITRMKPIARCGYLADYCVLDELFQMRRPA